jgi:hypothetical protein
MYGIWSSVYAKTRRLLGPPVLIFAVECSTAEISKAVLKNLFAAGPDDFE